MKNPFVSANGGKRSIKVVKAKGKGKQRFKFKGSTRETAINVLNRMQDKLEKYK